MKKIIINTISVVLIVSGFAFIVFDLLEPWEFHLGIICIISGVAIKKVLEPKSIGITKNIGFIESFKPFEGCEKEYKKMGIGVVLILAGPLIVYFYKNTELMLPALIISIPVSGFGIYMATRYIKCVFEYNEKVKN